MSIININRNIFLEKEELIKFQDFMINNVTQQVVLENTTNWGIVRSVFTGTAPDFLIEAGTNSGTVKIATASKAVDSDKLLIKQPIIDNIAIPTANVFYWMKISHKYSNLEVGTCSINVNGEVSGSSTKFTDVLRGQSTEVPVKIMFYKSSGLVNDQVYEVVDVTDDLNILLSGAGFSVETGLNYIVVGSTPVGETITSDQKDGLYQYDSCKIDFVLESSLDTPPAGLTTDKEFWIARVKNVSGTVSIVDKRTEYLTFNVEGVNDKLAKAEDLNDVNDKAAARANLGVLSAAETTALLNASDSGWKALTPSVAAWSTDFDLKIRRIGKLCIVQGTFKDGGNCSDNAIIAQILYTALEVDGVTPRLGTKVRFQCGSNINHDVSINIGMFGYIPISLSTDIYLYLKVEATSGITQNGATKFNINFSFYLD